MSRIVSLDAGNRDQWNALVDDHPDGWWWHRAEWMEYCTAYREDSEHVSYMLTDDDGTPRVLQPLMIEGGELKASGAPIPHPLGFNATHDHVALAADYLESVAMSFGATRSLCQVAATDSMIAAGWRDVSWQMQVVHLGASTESLFAGLRKSYRHIVRDSALTFLSSDSTMPSIGSLMGFAKTLHRTSAGHQTRPDDTWAMQRDWCSTGNGLVVVAFDAGGTAVGFAYLIVYKDRAYYASGASLEPNVQHAIQWRAMCELKRRGIRHYDIGWQGQSTDYKGDNIEFFKRGFGGQAVRYPVAELIMEQEAHVAVH